MTTHDFSFEAHSADFDTHIRSSIPGYETLIGRCVEPALRFVQPDTNVVDIGCSTGHLLAAVRAETSSVRKNISYIGIDIEPAFSTHWPKHATTNTRFEIADAREFAGFNNVSLAYSVFTVQFIPARDKLALLRRIHNGLVPGGALVIAEKILASTARLQDALTFCYYDYKLDRGFSAVEILDKERSLRGQMTLWTRIELEAALRNTGFSEWETIWECFPFVALLALKRAV